MTNFLKKLLVVLMLFFAFSADADTLEIYHGNGYTPTTGQFFGGGSYVHQYGIVFTPNSDFNISKIQSAFKRVSSTNAVLSGEIYEFTGDDSMPAGSMVASSVNTYAASLLDTSAYTEVAFNFNHIPVTAGTSYLFVVKMSGGEPYNISWATANNNNDVPFPSGSIRGDTNEHHTDDWSSGWGMYLSSMDISVYSDVIQSVGCGTVTDYDSNSYNTLVEGNLCWLATNLKSTHDSLGNAIDRKCYNDDSANCDLRGGLYQWNTVMNGGTQCDGTNIDNPTCTAPVQGICPAGWHVPSSYEYQNLGNVIAPGLYNQAAQDAFTSSTWSNGIPGYYTGSGYFHWGIYADYWSSSKLGANPARFAYGGSEYHNTDTMYGIDSGFSVRCVNNIAPELSVHNITKGTHYSTIQSAINNANTGDEIHVDSGIYKETLNINKQLILKGIDTGSGKPIVNANGTGNAMNVSVGNITIDGFAITGSGPSNESAGIYITSSGNTIKNNEVSNNGGKGMYLYYSGNNQISDNVVNKNGAEGIFLRLSVKNLLTDNVVISNNWQGVLLSESSSENTLLNNTVSSNGAGGSPVAGIELISYSSNNKLADNLISFNTFGISVSSSYGNDISGNTASYNNEAGITITFWSADNKIYHNNFIDNYYSNTDDKSGPINVWNDNYPSGGNYWSNYAGVDLYSGVNQDQPGGDGIADASYMIPCNNFIGCGGNAEDKYPLMKPYDGQPLPENQAPKEPEELGQFMSDGTIVSLGRVVEEKIMVFKGKVSDLNGDKVKLQVELKLLNENFNGNPPILQESALVDNGNEASLVISGLTTGDYHWRARAIDEYGNKSEWKEFGDNTADFKILIDKVLGCVYDVSNNPIEGVNISIYKDTIKDGKYSNGILVKEILTSSDGCYTADLDGLAMKFENLVTVTSPYIIIASKDGYISHGDNFFLLRKDKVVNFTLPKWSEVEKKTFSVVLVKFNDTDDKLSPKHNAKYFENIIFPQINDYYFENSYGKTQFDFKIYDASGQWYSVDNNMSSYSGESGKGKFNSDAWSKAGSDISANDGIINVHPSSSSQQYSPNDYIDENGWNDGEMGKSHLVTSVSSKTMIVAENEPVGKWVHEIGHLLGLSDVYDKIKNLTGVDSGGLLSGNIKEEGLMGGGDSTGNPSGFKPVHMESYSKIKAGYLTRSSFIGERDIPVLSKMHFGDSVQVIDDLLGKILIEGRNNGEIFSRWDSVLPVNYNGVNIYKDGLTSLTYTTTLSSTGQTANVSFSPLSDIYNIKLIDDQVSDSDINYRIDAEKKSIFSKIGSWLSPKIVGGGGGGSFAAPFTTLYPDTDLHAYTSDGRHVGMNYETGEYENQIEGAIFSGDIRGGDEWILVPENEDVHFTVDNRDSKAFYEKYPEYLDATGGKDNFSLTSYNYDVNGQAHARQEENFSIGTMDDVLNYSYRSYNISFLPPLSATNTYDLEKGSILPIKFKVTNDTDSQFVNDNSVNIAILDSIGNNIATFNTANGVNIDPALGQYSFDLNSLNYPALALGEEYTVKITFADSGNTVGSAAAKFKVIDTLPPATTIALSGTSGNNGWYVSNVEVHLSAGDNAGGSGVAKTEYSFDNSIWNTYSAPVTIADEGTKTIYYRSIDNAGNTEETKTQIIKIDKTLPEITVNSPLDGSIYFVGQNVVADWLSIDGFSGIDTTNSTVPSGSAIDTSFAGLKTFTITATDKAGNSATRSINYSVRYIYSGVLDPLKQDGSRVSKLGSTIPVKFQLKDASGNYIPNAQAYLFISKVSETVTGTEEASSAGEANTGNLFRYDTISNQYIFNLGTKDLSVGTWQLSIKLDDGTVNTVNVSLK